MSHRLRPFQTLDPAVGATGASGELQKGNIMADHDHQGAHPGAPGSHDHRGTSTGRALTTSAISATLHCLTGCAIGEVLGMIIGTAFGWHNSATIAISVLLAFLFGYGLTIRPVLAANVPFASAVKVALAADTLSILTMEVIDNGVIVAVPGAMDAGLSSVLFWASLFFSLVIAFIVTVPVNRWLIGRGKGHAVMHEYHH